MEKYLRTFIGLPLLVDPGFLRARGELMRALEGDRISWTNPDQFHVTIRFIGDTKHSSIRRIGRALHAGVNVPGPTGVNVGNLGSFGPRKRPRVIWTGFKETEFIESLKLEVDRALELVGIPRNEQEFRAHLTLGRVRSLQDLQRYYMKVEEMEKEFVSPVVFEKLVFFRSVPGSKGPDYQVLDEIQFT